MKICTNCKRKYDDNFSFCSSCGTKLQEKQQTTNHKSIIIAAIVIILMGTVGIIIVNSEQNKTKNTKREVDNYKLERAIQEYKSTPTVLDLKINYDWKSRKDGNYTYINGSVTNVSSNKTISYYEVEAKFYDSAGNIIDSDWTNDGDDLAPGETRPFEIMHRYNSEVDDIKLSVRDVS